ncbi:unnamed protein product [Mycena citricolor]|uniref:Uncharacterized protein n=1 Tax=Mycena citricolor TaxID=2018698 RepID=A0AAD2GRT9_9AGAR|nr:unnamed protein product [Mycena citricolor]
MSDEERRPLIDLENNVVRHVQSVWSGLKGHNHFFHAHLCHDTTRVRQVSWDATMSSKLQSVSLWLAASRNSSTPSYPMFFCPRSRCCLSLEEICLLNLLSSALAPIRRIIQSNKLLKMVCAITLAWGAFLDNLITFFALGAVLYTYAQLYAIFTKESIIKHIVKCKYCRKDISASAKRCAFCTSWTDGRDEKQAQPTHSDHPLDS